MPLLTHSPADVLRSLLVALGLAAYPPATPWPAFLGLQPDQPDDALTLTDTPGRKLGRRHHDGRVLEYPGVQVLVRSSDHATGWAKAAAVESALDESVYDTAVAVGASSYLVHSVTRTSKAVFNGKETLRTARTVFTLNVLLDLRQVA